MYTLELNDGTKIQGLQRVSPFNFQLQANDSNTYWQLSEYNLSFALLLDEEDDDLLVDWFIDYKLQNYSCMGGLVCFKLGKAEDLNKEPNRVKKKWDKKQGRCRK